MRVLLLLTASGLAACSPYSFPREVAAVSAGVDQVSDGFAAGYAGLAADRATKAQLDLIEARAPAGMPNSCLHPADEPRGKAPCALFPMRAAAPEPLPIEDLRPRTVEALRVLKDYAHALEAVTDAGDRAAFDAAASQLRSSVQGLAGGAAAAPGAGASAALALLGWVVGEALDQQRFDALRAGVDAARKPIRVVAETLGKGLDALAEARRGILVDEANLLTSRLGPSLGEAAYRERLVEAESVMAALNGLRTCDPKGTARALIEAHDALAAAVDDARSYPGLLTAVGAFADKAAALRAAFAAGPEAGGPAGAAAPGRTAGRKGARR